MQEITDMQKKCYKNQINKNEAKREKSNLNNTKNSQNVGLKIYNYVRNTGILLRSKNIALF